MKKFKGKSRPRPACRNGTRSDKGAAGRDGASGTMRGPEAWRRIGGKKPEGRRCGGEAGKRRRRTGAAIRAPRRLRTGFPAEGEREIPGGGILAAAPLQAAAFLAPGRTSRQSHENAARRRSVHYILPAGHPFRPPAPGRGAEFFFPKKRRASGDFPAPAARAAEPFGHDGKMLYAVRMVMTSFRASSHWPTNAAARSCPPRSAWTPCRAMPG